MFKALLLADSTQPAMRHLWTRSSTNAAGPRDALSVKILLVTKNHSWKACSRWKILKIIQGHWNCHYAIGHTSLPISGL